MKHKLKLRTSLPRHISRCALVVVVGFCAGMAQAATANDALARIPAQMQNWTQAARPAQGAPNIVLIMTDDVGFGASSTFGGPIPTPTFQSLADHGLRYNRFHVTAICSATRAALLTGRNHHAVGMGTVADLPTQFDGYNPTIPDSAATVAKVLQQNGYSTALVGKSHVTPPWETGPAGPFTRWPTGLGFDYFYGFVHARTDQYAPTLHEGTRPVTLPKDASYILDKDLADRAIDWLHLQRSSAPDRPFFLYYATGSTHSPHQAPPEWIAKFKGQFDEGWDRMREQTLRRQIELGVVPKGTRLASRPLGIPAWKDVPRDQQKLFARQMEVYAGMLAFADHEIGRVIDAVRAEGVLDNTLVIFIQGDNGASGEGGLNGLMNESNSYNGLSEDQAEARRRIDELGSASMNANYAAGWATALNTPFPWMKQFASHLGGTRNGMVLSWPERIKQVGQVRSQYHHVTDIMPTILAAARIDPPNSVAGIEQSPIEGVDMSYSFDTAKAPSPHRRQYYEMLGNAAIYEDGWLASTVPVKAPWESFQASQGDNFADRTWELYNLEKDFSQTENVVRENPGILSRLKALFLKEAERNKVKPGYRGGGFFAWDKGHDERRSFVYEAPMTRIPMPVAPDILNRSFKITANVATGDRPSGTIVTQGGRFGGYCLCIVDGKPVFRYNAGAGGFYQVAAPDSLSKGDHHIIASFVYDGDGRGKGGRLDLEVDGKIVASGRIERTLSVEVSIDETFDIGSDTGTSVTEDGEVPFAFNGKIHRVSVELP